MTPEYPQSLERLGRQQPTLAADLADLTSLDKVLGWLHRAGVALDAVESVPQDEYSHDVVMPLPDGRWLAFAVT